MRVLKVGFGPRNAAEALERFIRACGARKASGSFFPDLIISSGLAGSLSAEVATGTWVLAKSIHMWRNPARLDLEKVEAAVPVMDAATLRERSGISAIVEGAVITSGEVFNYAPGVAESLRHHASDKRVGDAVIIDMESAALARVANAQGVPFLTLRLVSDSPQKPLPGFVASFARGLSSAGGASKAKRVSSMAHGVLELARNPRGLFGLLKDSREWTRLLEEGWRQLPKGLV